MNTKQIIPISLLVLTFSACTQLSEDDVREFAINHIESQVGYEAGIEGYLDGLSENLIVWSNPVWRNTPAEYIADGADGSSLYEDSIKATIHDIYMMGNHANVYGTVQWYIDGVNTTYRNFSGIVGKEDGKLKWQRWLGVDNSELAQGFLWPSTELEGGLYAYNEMRNAMMNLEFDLAKLISDTLVEKDPNWATAHLGQLQYYWAKNDVENLEKVMNLALSKTDNSSRAEKHFIQSYTRDREIGQRELELAMMHAPDDHMIRIWYAWELEDNKLAIDILKRAWWRLPEHGGVNNMLGYKYMADGNMEKAKKHFEIFARANADVPNAFDSYGDFYIKAGDLDKAKKMFLKAYELDSSWTASKEKAERIDERMSRISPEE
ncbi:MAG: Uncharacterised protein [Owenweeksia sp. TMED14]|nr:MAG: Uncharacterised protein [Owenweeksia sp. TMED14]